MNNARNRDRQIAARMRRRSHGPVHPEAPTVALLTSDDHCAFCGYGRCACARLPPPNLDMVAFEQRMDDDLRTELGLSPVTPQDAAREEALRHANYGLP